MWLLWGEDAVNWTARIVEELLRQRACGVTGFDEAWELATLLVSVPSGGHNAEGEAFPVFFKRMCRREWNGETLADYAGLAEMILGDRETRMARAAGSRRVSMRRVA